MVFNVSTYFRNIILVSLSIVLVSIFYIYTKASINPNTSFLLVLALLVLFAVISFLYSNFILRRRYSTTISSLLGIWKRFSDNKDLIEKNMSRIFRLIRNIIDELHDLLEKGEKINYDKIINKKIGAEYSELRSVFYSIIGEFHRCYNKEKNYNKCSMHIFASKLSREYIRQIFNYIESKFTKNIGRISIDYESGQTTLFSLILPFYIIPLTIFLIILLFTSFIVVPSVFLPIMLILSVILVILSILLLHFGIIEDEVNSFVYTLYVRRNIPSFSSMLLLLILIISISLSTGLVSLSYVLISLFRIQASYIFILAFTIYLIFVYRIFESLNTIWTSTKKIYSDLVKILDESMKNAEQELNDLLHEIEQVYSSKYADEYEIYRRANDNLYLVSLIYSFELMVRMINSILLKVKRRIEEKTTSLIDTISLGKAILDLLRVNTFPDLYSNFDSWISRHFRNMVRVLDIIAKCSYESIFCKEIESYRLPSRNALETVLKHLDLIERYRRIQYALVKEYNIAPTSTISSYSIEKSIMNIRRNKLIIEAIIELTDLLITMKTINDEILSIINAFNGEKPLAELLSSYSRSLEKNSDRINKAIDELNEMVKKLEKMNINIRDLMSIRDNLLWIKDSLYLLSKFNILVDFSAKNNRLIDGFREGKIAKGYVRGELYSIRERLETLKNRLSLDKAKHVDVYSILINFIDYIENALKNNVKVIENPKADLKLLEELNENIVRDYAVKLLNTIPHITNVVMNMIYEFIKNIVPSPERMERELEL